MWEGFATRLTLGRDLSRESGEAMAMMREVFAPNLHERSVSIRMALALDCDARFLLELAAGQAESLRRRAARWEVEVPPCCAAPVPVVRPARQRFCPELAARVKLRRADSAKYRELHGC
jgi:hypothetical protein